MGHKPIAEYEVPEDLYGTIVGKIKNEAKKRTRRNFFVSVVAALTSFAALAPALVWLYRDAIQSGFLQSLSLVLSDSEIIARSWKDFTSLLLETMPLLSVVVCLGLVLSLLGSLRFIFKSKVTLLKYTTI